MRNFIILISLLFFSACLSQTNNPYQRQGDFRLVFYNVENLFDTYDDSLTRDNDFLPQGNMNWNYERYNTKLKNIYKTLLAAGGDKPPEIVGLCEIENRLVLENLVEMTPMKKFGYKIIHKDSPDERGIDVALLYLEKKFKPLNYKAYTINFPDSIEDKTRDILMVKGLLANDTIYVFVNHWPSRTGGQAKSEWKRMYVASVLKSKCDSILNKNADSRIIIMGDLNDDPNDRSLTESLGAKTSFDYKVPKTLYNISYYLREVKNAGTLKYRGKWNLFDQLIVSEALLKDSGLVTSPELAGVFKIDFLMKDDEEGGNKPFRTYEGKKYVGGFSDHLPVFLDIKKVEDF